MMRTAVLTLALLLPGGAARATPGFPGAVQRILGATQAPPCAVCHAGGQTGLGTVTTPFGLAMRARGLAPGDEASLQTALTRLEADRVDSNGNGVLDVDELRAGSDPNADASHPQPTYGCAVAADPRAAGWPLWLLGLGLVWLGVRAGWPRISTWPASLRRPSRRSADGARR
jgi:MYXO-CTERM domain-containing protein